MRRIWIMTALAAMAPSVSLAAPAPATVVCHDTSTFIAFVREREGEPILVRKRGVGAYPCAGAPKASDFVAVPPGEPRYFLALKARYLALDVGTGPDRTLMIVDLARRKTVVDAAYDAARLMQTGAPPNGLAADDAGFTFWRIGKRLKAPACPADWRGAEANEGLAFAHAAREVRFTFADATLQETGVSGCAATQDDVT